VSGEKTRKLDTRKTVSSDEKNCVDKTIGQLTNVRTPRRHKKLSRWITKTHHSKYSFALGDR